MVGPHRSGRTHARAPRSAGTPALEVGVTPGGTTTIGEQVPWGLDVGVAPRVQGPGLQFIGAARAAGHGLPAILSSGFDPADPEDADELRPFRRLAKPVRRDQLLRCIQGLQELAPAG